MYQATDNREEGHRSRRLATALYVDVENLQEDAQQIIQSLVTAWPQNTPEPNLLYLYVRADQAQLWKLWATSRFPHLHVIVKGIQHFSLSAKNSADISIAIDSIADLLLKKVGFVVLLSDDSDFISVCTKLLEEKDAVEQYHGRSPFLWVLTDREGTRSTTLRDFFPNEYVYVLQGAPKRRAQPRTPTTRVPRRMPPVIPNGSDSVLEMANAILREIPVGKFKSTDCQRIIKQGWPNNSLAKASGPAFGTDFSHKIWPELEKRGVKLLDQKPRRYEMTQEAKESVT